ncbi:hypothetical protein EV361DRAFT_769844, partial [Lentinula raphanica]
ANTVQTGLYCKMILGPLPHIMVFLDLLYISTQESKNIIKKDFQFCSKSEQIDKLDKCLTQTKYPRF